MAGIPIMYLDIATSPSGYYVPISKNGATERIATEDILPSSHGFYRGTFITSDDALSGVGVVSVRYVGHLAIISYNLRVTVAGTDASNFNYGLSASALSTAAGKTITPVNVSCPAEFFDSSGVLDLDFNGYGGYSIGSSGDGHWKFGRMYQTSGTIGHYASKNFTVGIRLVGMCYGTVSS